MDSPFIPSYRLHKSSGQAVVTINKKMHYLGVHGSPESRQKYKRLIAEFLDRGAIAPVSASALTVAQLIEQHWAYAQKHYGHRRYAEKSLERIKRSLSIVAELYAEEPAAAFGPKSLKLVRGEMVRKKWSRGHVNQCIGVVVRAWRWAVSDELIPAATLTALESVDGLGIGARGVTDGSPRLDVPWEHVRRSLRWLSPMARAIVLTLWYTGGRPTEIMSMRGDDVNVSADPWIYKPRVHKCDWRGQGREILIGRMGQRVLQRLIDRAGDGFVFPSIDSETGHFTDSGLRAVVRLAALRAGVPHWSPYQLRHSFITRICAEFDEKTACTLAGQKTIQSTRRYNHQPINEMMRVIARKAG